MSKIKFAMRDFAFVILFLTCFLFLEMAAKAQNEQLYEYGILIPPANLGGKPQTEYVFVIQDKYEVIQIAGPFKQGIGHWGEVGLNSFHTIVNQMNVLSKDGWEPYISLNGSIVFRRPISN